MKQEKRGKKIWIDPESAALAHLPKPEPKRAPKPRERRDPEKESDQRLTKGRACDLDALDHEIEQGKRRCEAARWETRANNVKLGLPEIPAPGQEATRSAQMEQLELRLRELEAIAKFGEEKVTRARTKAIEIHNNLHMRKDEKRTRIRAMLDAFEVDESILPPAIAELLEEEECTE